MKIKCSCCGKHVIQRQVSRFDRWTTTAFGAKCGFGNEVFCGHCADELDENGLFPEERGYEEFLTREVEV